MPMLRPWPATATGAALAALAALTLQPRLAAAPSALEAEIRADWARHLRARYEDFHRHPKLGFQETRTAAIMAQELGAIPGMKVTEGVGKTGVVAVLANGAGPVLLIRADMDGLPLEEQSGLPFASRHRQVGPDGVSRPTMHACGHDTHITGLFATARRLAAHRDRWAGTVVFVVQPAEELLTGAPAMLADGLYTRFPKPAYALAFHVAAGLPTGTISFSDSIQYASSDGVDVIVPGVGAHGASPHMGRDPILIGAAIVQALQSVRSRELSPLEPSVITVGTFTAGSARNIIPDRAELGLTIRANSEENRAAQIRAVERIAVHVGRAHGLPEDGPVQVIRRSGTPVTANSKALADRLRPALAAELGADRLLPFVQQGMGAEDFAFFIEATHGVEGLDFAVGGTPQAEIDAARNGGPPIASHHSPLFRVDGEAAVVTGARAMTAAALELLRKTP